MIGFDTLRIRLLDHIRRRISNGEVTERALARSSGISQPHMHNLLKGIRSLTPGSSDQLLTRLGLTVVDLLEADELRRVLFLRAFEDEIPVEVPVLNGRLGPGLAWPSQLSLYERVKVPQAYVARVRQPVVARLGEDRAMEPVLNAGDLVLLDSSEEGLAGGGPESLYAVQHGPEVMIRWIRPGRGRLYLVAAEWRDEPQRWEAVPETPAVIRARAIPLRSMRRQQSLYDPLLPLLDIPRVPARRSAAS